MLLKKNSLFSTLPRKSYFVNCFYFINYVRSVVVLSDHSQVLFIPVSSRSLSRINNVHCWFIQGAEIYLLRKMYFLIIYKIDIVFSLCRHFQDILKQAYAIFSFLFMIEFFWNPYVFSLFETHCICLPAISVSGLQLSDLLILHIFSPSLHCLVSQNYTWWKKAAKTKFLFWLLFCILHSATFT